MHSTMHLETAMGQCGSLQCFNFEEKKDNNFKLLFKVQWFDPDFVGEYIYVHQMYLTLSNILKKKNYFSKKTFILLFLKNTLFSPKKVQIGIFRNTSILIFSGSYFHRHLLYTLLLYIYLLNVLTKIKKCNQLQVTPTNINKNHAYGRH